MIAVAVAVLLAVAVGVLVAPARSLRPRAGGGGARWRLPGGRRPGRRPEIDLGVLVTEVATRLRTGADVESAWGRTFARAGLLTGAGTTQPAGTGRGLIGDDGVPHPLLDLATRAGSHGPLLDLATRAGSPGPLLAWRTKGPVLGATADGALPGAVAACRLTHEIGAPLAEVLERCAAGITEAGQARAARAVALAGPRSTARLLGWLPLLGLALGVAVGADPVAVLLDGRLGTLCLALGLGFMGVGRWWVASLERRARTAGTQPAGRADGRGLGRPVRVRPAQAPARRHRVPVPPISSSDRGGPP
ncbi:MAG: hypothetical protein ACYC1Z_04150 [Georgenia sp.]